MLGNYVSRKCIRENVHLAIDKLAQFYPVIKSLHVSARSMVGLYIASTTSAVGTIIMMC